MDCSYPQNAIEHEAFIVSFPIQPGDCPLRIRYDMSTFRVNCFDSTLDETTLKLNETAR